MCCVSEDTILSISQLKEVSFYLRLKIYRRIMVNSVAVTVFLALIKVSVGLGLLNRTYQQVNGLVNVRFTDARVIANIEYKLQCASACDQNIWCNAITWDEKTKTCHGFTKSLHQEVTPPEMLHVYTSDKDVCLGDGYTNTSGMCIKFFADEPPMTWQNAEDFCISEGGRLAVADTLVKYRYILNRLGTDGLQEIKSWWAGGKKIGDTWMWTTNLPVNLEFGMIINDPEYAFCLEFYLGTFNDKPCLHDGYVICEK